MVTQAHTCVCPLAGWVKRPVLSVPVGLDLASLLVLASEAVVLRAVPLTRRA